MSLIAATYSAILGLTKRTWASGMTVKKNEVVKSPADNEDYERITATGGGTTDPADDITNYVARSYVRTVAIPAESYAGGTGAYYGTPWVFPTSTFSAAANARTRILNVTGKGSINTLILFTGVSATSAIFEIVVDGRVVLSHTRTNMPASYAIVLLGRTVPADESAAGSYTMDRPQPEPCPVIFKRSLEVYVTSTSQVQTNARVGYRIRSEA